MKIALITSVPVTMFFYTKLIERLIQEGNEVHAISSGLPEMDTLKNMGCITFPVEVTRKISPIKDFLAVLKIYKYLKKNKFHIVHSHTPKGGIVGMLSSFLAGIPNRIHTIHGLPLETENGIKRLVLKLVERITCKLANRVLSVSHSLKNRVVEEKIIRNEKVEILGSGTACGIDIEKFTISKELKKKARQIKESNSISPDFTVLGFIGRLTPDKGISWLIETFVEVYKEYENIFLLLIGPIDLSRDLLDESVLENINNHPAILHIGEVDDPTPYYAAMDILVLPSKREGFPYVLLEAASMQLPIIASRATGCVDAVVDKKTGLLVDIDDAQQLIQAIKWMIYNPEARQKMAMEGQKRVCSQFPSERLVESHLNLYQDLTSP